MLMKNEELMSVLNKARRAWSSLKQMKTLDIQSENKVKNREEDIF